MGMPPIYYNGHFMASLLSNQLEINDVPRVMIEVSDCEDRKRYFEVLVRERKP
jgi:hypothetical protein